MAKLIGARLSELLLERGWSLPQLHREMVRAGYDVSFDGLKQIKARPGRVPDAEIIEAIAAGFAIDPAVFYEYPIAVARRDGKSRATARDGGTAQRRAEAEAAADQILEEAEREPPDQRSAG